MTDKVKLEMVFEQMEVPCEVTPGALTAAGRKFYFDKDGTLKKIKDFTTLEVHTP